VRVVDAPVSGSAEDIADGAITVLLGGEPADVDEARSIVAAYGDPILPIGPLGSAQAIKLLNNSLFAAQVQLAAEVERLAAEFGIEPAAAAGAIQRASGASFAMGVVERRGSVASVEASAGHYLQKDVGAMNDVAAELGLDLGMLGHVTAHGPLDFG
jgi:3-hydroxyisobutyrate dehydrogenase-like beta-hydroxyacid dehydrogenase